MSSKKKNNANDIDNNDANEEGAAKAPAEDGQISKQTAADLEKVTDFHEDQDEMNEVSKESLGNLKVQPEQKKFTLRKEDIQTIIQELEVPRIIAERKLVEHEGNLRAAILDLIDFH